MAGPLPKSPEARARGNRGPRDRVGIRVIEITPAKQPKLPGAAADWHPQTLKWWTMWARSPLAAEFTEHEWSELTDTARVHTRFGKGDLKVASELRIRAAKFGVTTADRARLRIQFAMADRAEAKSAKHAVSAGFDGLHAVDD